MKASLSRLFVVMLISMIIVFAEAIPASAIGGHQSPTAVNGYFLPWQNGKEWVITGTPESHGNERGAIDFGLDFGSPVHAAKAGEVISAVAAATGGGSMLIIDTGDGYCSVYHHLSQMIRTSGFVNVGEQIAKSGKDSDDINGHLHFAVFDKSKNNGNCLAKNGKTYPTNAEMTVIFNEIGEAISKNGKTKAGTKVLSQNKTALLSVDSTKAYRITSANSPAGNELVLDVDQGSVSPGATIIQWNWEGRSNQRWIFEPRLANGLLYYLIKSQNSNLCVEAYEQGDILKQNTCNGSNNQLWLFSDAGEGKVTLQSAQNMLYMDVDGAQQNWGAPIVVFAQTGGANQKWLLRQADISTPPITFQGNVSSTPFIDQNGERANLTVCADNLAGNTINVLFWRDNVYWTQSYVATQRCLTFWDMDGEGPVLKGKKYYSVAAINQQPNKAWVVYHSNGTVSCFSSTGGQGLCDKYRR